MDRLDLSGLLRLDQLALLDLFVLDQSVLDLSHLDQLDQLRQFLPGYCFFRHSHNAATFFSSFLMARLMKSLIVMPVDATNAATRE